VSIDEQIFIMQRVGGVSRYFTNLCCGSRPPESGELAITLGFRFATTDAAVSASLAQGVPRLLRSTKSLYALNTPWRRAARATKICHQTYYHPRFLDLAPGQLRVSTLHDMIPEILPTYFATNPHLAKMEFLQRSDHIICVSESSRHDLLNLAPTLEDRTSVIHLGVSDDWLVDSDPAGPQESHLGAEYLLFVGARGGYKDFALLLRALAAIDGDRPALVVTGPQAFTPDEQRLIGELGLHNQVAFRKTTDHELRTLYQGALALVYPSRYEGFGLPVVEAMARGCPVVASSGGSLPEVGGTIPIYFEPGSLDSLHDALVQILYLPRSDRIDKGDKGQSRAKIFSVQAMTEKTLALYRSLL
jgi:glycosyltransferase involved in cell wall biosynthesis